MKLVTLLGAGFAIAAMVGLPVASRGAEPGRPNIVLIVADDMGYADTGVFGCKDIKTPNIDRLAAEGTRFTDAYVTGPICVPSRMGQLMSRYQQRWGIYGNADSYTKEGLRATAAETTIAEMLQKAGYTNAMFGKWHLSGNGSPFLSPPSTRPEQNGFDEVVVIKGGMSSYQAGIGLYYGGGREEKAPEYLTDYFGKLSLDFINRHKAESFFLCLTFNAVHAPLQSRPEDAAKYDDEILVVDRRTYAGMMTALDRNVGRVLDALAAAGLEKNTIVAFLSDNGGPAHDAPPHSRNMADNGLLRGHKFDVLEGGVRTPMIMKWPGKIPAGKKFSGISSSMDLGATFLAAAGLPAPADRPLDGVNLLPYLDGQKAGNPHETLFWDYKEANRPDCAARRGQWKIVQLRVGPGGVKKEKWELYDIANDIGEAHNVAQAHPEIVTELDAAFRQWRSQMPAPCLPPTWSTAAEPVTTKLHAPTKDRIKK